MIDSALLPASIYQEVLDAIEKGAKPPVAGFECAAIAQFWLQQWKEKQQRPEEETE